MLLICWHNLSLPTANSSFGRILNLQAALGSSENFNGYANYSGSVDASGNVSGSLSGQLATPFTIYNTGVDDNGTPLADGSVDPHYSIIAVQPRQRLRRRSDQLPLLSSRLLAARRRRPVQLDRTRVSAGAQNQPPMGA